MWVLSFQAQTVGSREVTDPQHRGLGHTERKTVFQSGFLKGFVDSSLLQVFKTRLEPYWNALGMTLLWLFCRQRNWVGVSSSCSPSFIYCWDIYAHRTAREQTVKLRIKLISHSKGSCIANMKYYDEIIGGMVSLTRLSWKFTPIARRRQMCRSDPRRKNVFTL